MVRDAAPRLILRKSVFSLPGRIRLGAWPVTENCTATKHHVGVYISIRGGTLVVARNFYPACVLLSRSSRQNWCRSLPLCCSTLGHIVRFFMGLPPKDSLASIIERRASQLQLLPNLRAIGDAAGCAGALESTRRGARKHYRAEREGTWLLRG